MRILLCLTIMLALLSADYDAVATEQSLDHQEQQAWRQAVEHVADSVVQIRTVGGLEQIGKTLLSQGPTTGLVVSADGYIVSSAFNFAGQPTSILVRLATGEQLPAKLVARDRSRMLVLLKVDAKSPLPTVEAAVESEIRVGQWAVAVGRTFSADNVAVSVGIVSARNRMYGRVLQTDASISVANYGGPLVDTHGRILGVLVPMSPQVSRDPDAQVLAGAEFYDSGIGFAVPLEHILGVLERWQQGEDLLPGKLGVGLADGQAQLTPPRITTVWHGSPAAQAGWQPNDVIIAIDGTPIETQADLRYLVVTRYAGDQLNVTIRRGEEEIESEIILAGELASYRVPFLGILPARSGGEPGVVVRGVWPDSPAERAGIQSGDRLTLLAEKDIEDFDGALAAMKSFHPGDSVELVLQRGEEQLRPTIELVEATGDLLTASQASAWTQEDASEQPNDVKDELQELKLPLFGQGVKYFDPFEGKADQPGLLVWLGDGTEDQEQQLLEDWQETCLRDSVVLLIARPASEAGWSSEELEYLAKLVQVARVRWAVDNRRVVLAGQGKAGQLAYALALRRRSGVSGVVALDAPLPRALRITENLPGGRLQFLSVESPESTFAPLIRRDIEQLRKAGYVASHFTRTELAGAGEALDNLTQAKIARWIDALDRF